MSAKKRQQSRSKLAFASPSRLKQKRSEKFRKVGSFVALLILIFAIVVGFLSLGWGLRALFLSRNSHFALRQIHAESDGMLGEDDIIGDLADLGVVAGEANIFALDLKELRRQMKARNVLVKEVRFSRRLPGALEVEVFEPHPVARLRNGMLVARDGLVLPERSDEWASTLPLFTGFKNGSGLQPGDILADHLLQAGLLFLSMTKSDPSGEFLVPALIQPDYSLDALKIYLGSKGPFRDKAQLILPGDPEKMGLALAKVDTIARERYRGRQAIGFIDATYEKNIPVRP